MDRCEQCGFHYDLDLATWAPEAIKAGSVRIASVVVGAGDEIRIRPGEGVWSPLEYACHTRDVLLVQRERVLMALRLDTPDCPPMGREERAEHDGYNEQDPQAVARQLQDAALMFSKLMERLAPDQWDRTLMYNYPTRVERSLRWVAVHTQHEVVHHLADLLT